MKRLLFELCAPSLAAAIAADRGGADRIELCTNLAVGGVTPAPNLLASVLAEVSIPVHALIRPRAGDFVFSNEEFALMQREVDEAKSLGAAGVALGILLSNGRVDVPRSRALAEFARPMHVTFHRAFDETVDLPEALEDVIQTGADTLLTSGGAGDALTGARSIARLLAQAADRIELMAGGGLRLENMSDVLRRSGVRCLHGSLTRRASTANNGHENGTNVLEEDIRHAMNLLRSAPVELTAPAITRVRGEFA
ncbi:MAG TPA: copper homeostasis protein CutC [Terracidiphilus sp.]|jgi:copper homeostasis protein